MCMAVLSTASREFRVLRPVPTLSPGFWVCGALLGEQNISMRLSEANFWVTGIAFVNLNCVLEIRNFLCTVFPTWAFCPLVAEWMQIVPGITGASLMWSCFHPRHNKKALFKRILITATYSLPGSKLLK